MAIRPITNIPKYSSHCFKDSNCTQALALNGIFNALASLFNKIRIRTTKPNNIISAIAGHAIMDGIPPSTNTGRMTLKPVNAMELGIRKAHIICKTESCYVLCQVNVLSEILISSYLFFYTASCLVRCF